MKKIIALLLALVMVMGLATVVSAETPDGETPAAPKFTTNVQLKKLFTITGATGADDVKAEVYPHETLTFTATPDEDNPDGSNLTIAPLEVKGPNGTMAITLPDYTKVGTYVYTVSENAGISQGAGYAQDDITLTVLVSYAADGKTLEAAVYLTQANAGNGTQSSQVPVDGKVAKVDTFVNTYDVGHLTVKKTISGNLASAEQYFDFTVTFKAADKVTSVISVSGGTDAETVAKTAIAITDWSGNEDDGYTYTHTFKLKADETLTFINIPDGVTYTVDEADIHADDDASNGSDTAKGYTVTGEVTNQKIVSKETKNVVVNNAKSTEVDTGIAMDSVPFIVMAVVAVIGLAAFTAKKRVQE